MNINEEKYKYFPKSWYPILKSCELKRGQIKEVEAFNSSFIVYRSEDGSVGALFSHCPHMGTKYLAGKVVGKHLQCPLHLREFDTDGKCKHIPGSDKVPANAHNKSFPVHETAGIIFVFLGTEPSYPFPTFSRVTKNMAYAEAATYVLKTPYQALIFNGFDTHHLGCIHHRKISQDPKFQYDRHLITAEYSMSVIAATFYDWVVKTISSAENDISLECYGGNLLIITNHSTKDNILITSVPITYNKSRIFLTAVGEQKTNLLASLALKLRLKITTKLGVDFLRPDIKIIEDMRPDLRNFLGTQDKGAAVFWDYWDQLERDIAFQDQLRR